jgi:hypothetical protein
LAVASGAPLEELEDILMRESQSLFNLTIALHVSGVTITHLQENKTTVTTASGNRYTLIDRVKFIDKEYR